MGAEGKKPDRQGLKPGVRLVCGIVRGAATATEKKAEAAER